MSRKLKQVEAEIPRLRRYARYLTRDVDSADDLVQECLIRAVAKIDTWKDGTNLRAWLFVILKNCHINEVRQRSRYDVDSDLVADHPSMSVPAGQEAHMTLLEVRDAFLRLSQEHREILLLVAIEGMQYDEAAIVLNIAMGTVRSRLSRARQALREILEEPDRETVTRPMNRAAEKP